jgi:hypothetical protein
LRGCSVDITDERDLLTTPAFPKLVGRELICGGSQEVFEM